MSFTRKSLPLCLLLTVLASGCSMLNENKVDYRSVRKGETLEVPPDLTALSRSDRYALNTDGSVSASGYQNANIASQSVPVAANHVADAHIERSGDQRWLVVDRPAAELWPLITGFWKDNGFTLENQQEALGIMETDWAENRAKLPQDFVRETLGKVFDSLYDTGERDKFRTRLETRNGKTEIYITHRGMVEKLVSKNGHQDGGTIWEPRPSDPELETEFLRRLMLKLGASAAQAQAEAKSPATQAAPSVKLVGDALEIDDSFDSAWRKVGLALDRSNFTVADRDRSKGIYFVRYIPDDKNAQEPGFFSKLFGSSKEDTAAAQAEYRVIISADASSKARTIVQNPTGGTDDTTRKILKLLADSLK